MRGARAVVALPINVLPNVAFDPPLPAATAEAAGTNAGRAYKIWFHARGLPAASVAAGAGVGVDWIYADRDLGDGTVLALGFGYEDPSFDPHDAAQVEAALRAFWPEAELLAYDLPRLEHRPARARHVADRDSGQGGAADARAVPAARPALPGRRPTSRRTTRAGSRARSCRAPRRPRGRSPRAPGE